MLPANDADRVRRSQRRTMRLFAGTVLSVLAMSGLVAGSGVGAPSPARSAVTVMVVLSFLGNGVGAIVSAFTTRRIRSRAMLGSTPPRPGSEVPAGPTAPPMPGWPTEYPARALPAERTGPWVSRTLGIAALLAFGWFVAWGLVVQTGIGSHQQRLLTEGTRALATVEWVSSSSEGLPIGADAGRIGVGFWDRDVRIHATIHLRDGSPTYRVGQPVEIWYDPASPAAWVVTRDEPNRPPLATVLGYLAIVALVFALVVGAVQVVKMVAWFSGAARAPGPS